MANLLSPPGWGKDELTKHFDQVLNNTYVTFQKMPTEMALATKLEELFREVSKVPNEPKFFLQYLFLNRTYSAFLASARLAIGTQIPESYMVSRGCLENALYGFFIFKNHNLIETYLKRDASITNRKKFRQEFVLSKMIKVLTENNPQVGAVVHSLYEKTIDLGAHPNEKALTSSTRIQKRDEGVLLLNYYLTNDELHIKSCFKVVLQVGIAALKIVECVLVEKSKHPLLNAKIQMVFNDINELKSI